MVSIKALDLPKLQQKKGLEFLLGDKNIDLIFYLMLVLLSADWGGVLQEDGRKRNSVWPHNTSNSKVILVLLEKIITFHMDFTLVNV